MRPLDPPLHPYRRTARCLLGLAVVATLAGTVGCSSSNGDDAGPSVSFAIPQDTLGKAAQGDECNDPVGDIADSVKGAGTLTDPPGIDLVHTEAKVVGQNLDVSYTTAGPIASATNPLFVLQQGSSAAINSSFELRAQASAQTGRWGLSVITFANNRERPATPLNVPVTVADNKVSYSVPLSSLPTIATIVWQFGATSGVSNNSTVIDDCEPFAQQAASPTTTATGAPTSTAVAAPIAGRVGAPLTLPDGSKVTITIVDNPAKPTRTPKALPLEENQLAAIQAEVCAGPNGLEKVGDFRFTVQTPEGRSFDPWAADDHTNDPQFKLDTTLRAGECTEKGWINYEIPKDSQISQITYDIAGKKLGPYAILKT